jgi:pimeloyl-ACP methyl ester carboxylesterase
LILLHGGMMASQGFMQLAAALADRFTLIVPDRRGRGSSGPYGDQYGIAREREDVQALIDHTGADSVFGLSSGAIIALESALALPAIRRVAAYEPPYSIAGRDNAAWSPRFDREVAAGQLGAAMLTVMKGAGASAWMRLLPYPLLTPLLNRALRLNDRKRAPDTVPLSALIPTLHYDARLVRETSSGMERFSALSIPVLLLGGGASPRYLAEALDVLAPRLAHAQRVELPRVGHRASADGEQPGLVARALREFFLVEARAPDRDLRQ